MPEPTQLTVVAPFRKRVVEAEGSPAVSAKAVKAANEEAMLWLADVASEVEYGPWCPGITIQTFMRIRQLALHDAFEDIAEEVKAAALQATVTEGAPPLDLKALRGTKEYTEIREALTKAASLLSKPMESETWIKQRAGGRARRHLERAMRDQTPDVKRDAVRAAATVVEIETPKASRVQIPKRMVDLPEEAIQAVTKAFLEAGITVIRDEPTPAD